MKKNLFKIIYFLCGLALAMPSLAHAVLLYPNPSVLDPKQPQPYLVQFVVDTQGEDINAIEGVLHISQDAGKPLGIVDANSIVTYWIQQPKVSNGDIKFSGAIPGGYKGSNGLLFSVRMPAGNFKDSNRVMYIDNVQGLRNDGLGTPVKVTMQPFAFRTGAVQSGTDTDLTAANAAIANDNTPPEIFSPQIARDDNIFNGQWFITFATQDKQSGIDHYEVQETTTGETVSGKWQVAKSPYLLKDQELHSYVFILAIDKQGNERAIKVYPRRPLPFYIQYGRDAAIVAGIMLFGALFYFLLKRYDARTTR